jgi:hypothetical protein
LSALRGPLNTFYANSNAATILARSNAQSALKGPPKGICAFESYRYTNIFNAIVATGQTVTRLVKPQPLDEVGRSGAKFRLESSTERA